MRWEKQRYRIVRRFAIFPICLKGEYRWLEIVYIEQRLFESWWKEWWESLCFTDKASYEDWNSKGE